ncbi:hypothetical protein M9H77_26843 [Catharanthus roseus]|uniref:Uncharacterized protein n=1 Tax=Catharanthus roseus TaxID=4058 RepID=A0ACC0ACD8_CATRO|nr:hypothetical protein M9H77_26843 [Catharanthus roseus]
MPHLAKGVLSPVLPSDPGMSLTSAPEVTVTKGRCKIDSTKMDKSYWEHLSYLLHIERYRSQADLDQDLMDQTGGMIVIGHLADYQHFITLHMQENCSLPPLHVQWQYHYNDRVND